MTAIISPCGTYRYWLTRRLACEAEHVVKVCVIMVNPSTADATENDATIRKLIGFGRLLDWSEFTVVNKFAYRATDVNELRNCDNAIGPLNDGYIGLAMLEADLVFVAWGASGKLPAPLRQRWRDIAEFAGAHGIRLYCWGVCEDGHPRHPVMIAYDTPIKQWWPPL